MQDTLTRKHVSMQDTLEPEHVSTQGTLALFLQKNSIVDVQQGSKYTSKYLEIFHFTSIEFVGDFIVRFSLHYKKNEQQKEISISIICQKRGNSRDA